MQRQSNIELLRIVSMLMVLAVHVDGASLGLPDPKGDIASLTVRDIWRIVVEIVAIIGVNCFTMISGYFGIRLRWRGLLSFLFQCVFYSVGIYTAVAIAFPGQFSWKGWLESWMVLTHTDLWYVPAYFGLMLLSPVLNAGLEALTQRTFAIMLAMFIGFNLWCGWWWHGTFNPTGYTLVQLVMVYMIARYIRLHVSIEGIKRHRIAIAWTYFALLVAMAAMALYMPPLQAYAYNSPIVLLSTVSFFLIFLSFDFTSRGVNYIARSAFAVYLIHKAPLMWINIMRPAVVYLWNALSLPLFTLAAAGVIIGFYLVAIAIDPLRRWMFDRLWRTVSLKRVTT